MRNQFAVPSHYGRPRGHATGALQPRSRSRRRGVVAIYVALMMATFMGVAAISFDLSYLYNRKAEAQKAADAAAMAGAACASDPTACGIESPTQRAFDYAAYNGYDVNNGATVQVTTPWEGNANYFHVLVSRPERLTFARFFLGTGATSQVNGAGTAFYQNSVPIPIDQKNYGLGTSAQYNYSMFGPYALYSYGDYTTPKYYDSTQGANNGKPNPDYDPTGINFNVSVPDRNNYQAKFNTSLVDVELFDPSTTDTGLDEIHDPGKVDGGYNGDKYTQTQYTLIWDKNGSATGGQPSDHVQLAQSVIGNDAADSRKWVTPDGFTIDLSQETTGSFHVNVQTINGASENGFSLRAGPPHPATMTDQQWHDMYATDPTTPTIGTTSILPLNFNLTEPNSPAPITLGNIPAFSPIPGTTNGGTITIKKFDTDVGALGLTYTMYNADGSQTNFGPGYTFQGSHIQLVTTNGAFSTDTIVLPVGFTGGQLIANYTAGADDTSEWLMSYSGTGQGAQIRLVQ